MCVEDLTEALSHISTRAANSDKSCWERGQDGIARRECCNGRKLDLYEKELRDSVSNVGEN